MENLEVRTTNAKSNKQKYITNLTNVITFLRHPEDKIIIRNVEQVEVEIISNGDLIFSGSKFDLFEKLKDD